MHGIISLNPFIEKSICVPSNSAFSAITTLNPYNKMYMVAPVILILIHEKTYKLRNVPKVIQVISKGPWI